MFSSNPYAAGGWPNPQNPLSVNAGNVWFPNRTHPPTFGALPAMQYTTSTLQFSFAPTRPDILSCVVEGPNHSPYFRVTTAHGVTTIIKTGNEAMSRIEWGADPQVEIRDVISKIGVSHWLKLSQDQSYRTMSMHGRTHYAWLPRGDAIVLLCVGSSGSPELARIVRTSGSVILNITTEAIQAGLLEVAIVATVLFQSGRNI